MENRETSLLTGAPASGLTHVRNIAAVAAGVALALSAGGWWYLHQPLPAPESPPQSAALTLPAAPVETAPPEQVKPALPPHDETVVSAPVANALAQITLRLSALEMETGQIKNQSSDTAASAVDAGAITQLDSAVHSINSSLDAILAAMTVLNARLAALEAVQAAQSLGAEGNRISMALSLRELERALNGSGPYAVELETLVKVLDMPSDPAITSLRRYAAAGVPARPQLLARFDTAAAAIVRADAASGSVPGWAGRAYGFVTSLVMIRPLGEREGADAPSRVARAQLRMEEGDLDAALRELSELEAAAAQAAEPWLKDARARQETERALAQLNAALTQQLNDAASPAAATLALPAGAAGE
ncbi:MAG: hypothetical protein EXR08_07350 [Alphaproteobacteria bacterium]|nr:hypothetical protein [Alphaproteobacteria bacterium]